MPESLESVVEAAARVRASGRCLGYASGVFDLFHRGHLSFLRECKSRCDVLIIGVDTDALVRSRKGIERPRDPISRRIEAVLNSGFADLAFPKECSADNFIGRISPARYFIAEDKDFSPRRMAILSRIGVELVLVPRTKGISTSDLLGRG